MGGQGPHPVVVLRQQLVHVGNPLAVDARGFFAVDLVHAPSQVREAVPREEARDENEAAAIKKRLLLRPETHARVNERLQRYALRPMRGREHAWPARTRRSLNSLR
jgi:hypothetical protein